MNILTLVISLIILLVIFLVVLFSFLKKEKPKKEYKRIKTSSEEFEIETPSAIGLTLPSGIESIPKSQLRDIVRKIFESFLIFDYRTYSINHLDKKEWHSWQISLVLMLFKHNEEFYIYDQSIFHDFLLNSTDNDIKSLMSGILRKYKNQVEVDDTKDALCKDYNWSNRDISIIFYFLANYKKFK